MHNQKTKRKKRVGRDKLSDEKVKKITINMPESDLENVSFVAKLQGMTTSAFIRDVLKFAVELEIGKREIYIFNEEKQSLEKLKIDLTYFVMEFEDLVSYIMRETLGARNQGYISIDENTEIPEFFWDVTGDDKTDDNSYLYLLISASKDKKIRFWSKQKVYESKPLDESEKSYLNKKEKKALEKEFKEAWGGVVPTPAKLGQKGLETIKAIAEKGEK